MTLDLLKRSENGAPLSATQHDANLTAIENAFNGISVADRAAMAALNTATGGYAFLKESGREGWFKWDSSNLSAQVTADPQQGVYVAPASAPTGASGAWVRQFEGPLHLDWWAPARDGVTDDSSKLQAAVTLASATIAPSRRIDLGIGTLALAATITVNTTDVFLAGLGADMRHSDTSFGDLAATRLKWTGAASGTIVKFESPTGAGNKKQSGGGVSGVMFDANSLADFGLEINSWNHGAFEWLGFKEFLTASMRLDVVASLSDARDTQLNRFSNFRIWQSAQDGSGIVLQSTTSGANPSFNAFDNIVIQHKNGAGIALFNCDNNHFTKISISRTGGGTGKSLAVHGSNAGAFVARGNVFDHLQATEIYIYGTATYTTPAGQNSFLNLDDENDTALPTVETGAYPGYVTFITGRKPETTIASAATTEIASSPSENILLTGTASISSFGNVQRKRYWIRASDAFTLVHGTNLIVPGNANLTAGAGDTFIAESDAASPAVWRIRAYQRRATSPPIGTNTGDQTITLSGDVSGSGTGAITTDLLAGYDLINAAFNGDLKKGDVGITKQTGWTITSDPANALSGNYVAKNTDLSGTKFVLVCDNYISCEPNDVIYLEGWYKTDASVTITICKAEIVWYDKDLTVLTSAATPNNTSPQTTYTSTAALLSAPASAAFARARFAVAKTLGNIWCGKLVAYRKRDAAQLLKANSVTLTEMAQIATASFLGRVTAATGNVENLSLATVNSMLEANAFAKRMITTTLRL